MAFIDIDQRFAASLSLPVEADCAYIAVGLKARGPGVNERAGQGDQGGRGGAVKGGRVARWQECGGQENAAIERGGAR